MRRLISPQTKIDIAQSYAKGRPVKVITYEFGIGKHTLRRIVQGAGLPLRHRYYTRNAMGPEAVLEAQRLFRSGWDTVTIARLLHVTEAKVANTLARARDQERAA